MSDDPTVDPAPTDPPLVDPVIVDIAACLADSRAAHARFHAASGSINQDGTVKTTPDNSAAVIAIREALNARLEADLADPLHTDPAWADDLLANRGVTHTALVDFYRDYLS